MNRMRLIILILCVNTASVLYGQEVVLTLDRAIAIAADSSLQAFRNESEYLSGYWEFRNFKAGRLPSLSLNLTPAQYYRDFTSRYDFENNVDVYRKQESFYAGGALQVNQNFDLLGGRFTLDSRLGYLRNRGVDTYSQFSSVPVRLGYSQELLGYNPFKWERRIEPLKYQKVKRKYLYSREEISETATEHFFALAMAQAEYDLARESVTYADTLYATGERRHRIASISKADLLTLKLDVVNARNALENASIALKRAMFSLASYLNFDKSTAIRLTLPLHPRVNTITVDEALSMARENNPDLIEMQQRILEAQQQVDKTSREAMFNASVNASVGFNQVADNLGEAYRDLLQQDIVTLSVSIPLVDWGIRKGKRNIARNNLNVNRVTARQKEVSVEEEVIMTVSDFNVRVQLIASAREALDLADLAYQETRQRFMIGQSDINSLTLSQNRQQSAQQNYVTALKNYWLSYFKIRKLTLYDFEKGIPMVRLKEEI